MELFWTVLHHILSEYGEFLCKFPYSVQMLEKSCTRKKLRTRTLSTQRSGFVVHKLRFALVSTLRDKFISLVSKVVSLVFNHFRSNINNKYLFFLLVGISLNYKIVFEVVLWVLQVSSILSKVLYLLYRFHVWMISYGSHIFVWMYLRWFRSMFLHGSFKDLMYFCFAYYVRNLTLVLGGTIRFIYRITVYCLCFLFRDYFFLMHIDNWFNICHAAITYFHIIFVDYFMIFMVVWKTFLN